MADYLRDQKNKIKSANVKKAETVLDQIEHFENEFRNKGIITNEKMTLQTEQWKRELAKISPIEERLKALDKIMPAAMALANIAMEEYHPEHIKLRDTQKLAAIALYYGTITELGTGEGKTASAVPFAYVYSLTGQSVHIPTTNDSLAERDESLNNPVYTSLGVTSSFVPSLGSTDVKQKSYDADIVHGANSTFAFDFSRDRLAKDYTQIVQRRESVAVLIDEVDDILLDNARVPYIISQNNPNYFDGMTIADLADMFGQTPEELIVKAKRKSIGSLKKDLETITSDTQINYHRASQIANICYNKDLAVSNASYHKLTEIFVSDVLLNNNVVYNVEDTIIGGKTYSAKVLFSIFNNTDVREGTTRAYPQDVIDFVQKKHRDYGVIKCSSSKEYLKTLKGTRISEEFLFYTASPEGNKLFNERSAELIKVGNLKEGVDYVNNQGQMVLSPAGALSLITENASEKIPDIGDRIVAFTEGRSELSGSDMTVMHSLIDLALDAHIRHENGVDYFIENGKVKLINAGRSAEGRVFGGGIQQAIEWKEAKAGNKIKFSPESKTVSQISQREYYSLYKRKAGMTGTSAELAFLKLYDMPTIEIPRYAYYDRYSERKKKLGRQSRRDPNVVRNHPDSFCKSEKEKMELIFQSCISSQEKNIAQPVVITALTVEESKKIYDDLVKRGLKPTLLNVENEKDEMKIIADAGTPGSITIVTEMAGRGTDIKLGGDRLALIQKIEYATGVNLTDAYQKIDLEERRIRQKNGGLPMMPDDYNALINKMVEDGKIPPIPEVAMKAVMSLSEFEALSAEMSKQGGLKIIGSGHFQLERVDDQLKGRTGRSGSGGETQFISTREDFLRMGASSKEVYKLFDELDRKGMSGGLARKMEKVIQKTQENNEVNLAQAILANQKLDKEIETYRTTMAEQRMKIVKNIGPNGELLSGNTSVNCSDIVDQFISDTVLDLIVVNTGHSSLKYSPSQSDLNIDALILEMKEMFGLELTREYINGVPSLKALRDEITISVQARHRAALERDPKGQTAKDAEIVLSTYDRTLEEMLGVVEEVNERRTFGSGVGSTISQNDTYNQHEYLNDFAEKMNFTQQEVRNGSVRFGFGVMLNDQEFNKLEEIRQDRSSRRYGGSLEQDGDVEFAKQDHDYVGVQNELREESKKREGLLQPGVTNLHLNEAMRRVATNQLTLIPHQTTLYTKNAMEEEIANTTSVTVPSNITPIRKVSINNHIEKTNSNSEYESGRTRAA